MRLDFFPSDVNVKEDLNIISWHYIYVCDLLYDVIIYCVPSVDMGKISVYDENIN